MTSLSPDSGATTARYDVTAEQRPMQRGNDGSDVGPPPSADTATRAAAATVSGADAGSFTSATTTGDDHPRQQTGSDVSTRAGPTARDAGDSVVQSALFTGGGRGRRGTGGPSQLMAASTAGVRTSSDVRLMTSFELTSSSVTPPVGETFSVAVAETDGSSGGAEEGHWRPPMPLALRSAPDNASSLSAAVGSERAPVSGLLSFFR